MRKETWDELQPKVTLRFKPNDDVTTYVSYSRGFRSGGFNQTGVGSVGIAGDQRPVRPGDGGHLRGRRQGRFLRPPADDGRQRLHTKAKGSYFFVFDPNTSTQNLGNLDKVEYQGLEVELQAQVTDGLEVYVRGG